MTIQLDDVSQISGEKWIPILDYAVMRGISTSTLRRYIKAQKIKYKIENGKYLLLAGIGSAPSPVSEPIKEKVQQTQTTMNVFHRVNELEEQLLRAEEQISELKMLVAIYEEKLSQSDH